MSISDLSDVTQVNVYQNLIKNKGTLSCPSAFKGAMLPKVGLTIAFTKIGPFKSGEFGGVTKNNFIELKLYLT